MKLGRKPPRREREYKKRSDYLNYYIHWDGSLYYVQANDGRFHGYANLQDAHTYIDTLPYRAELPEDD